MIIKNLLQFFFFLTLALSQFYFYPRGIQLQHIFSVFFIFFTFYYIIKNKINKSFILSFLFPTIFVIYALLINTFFFLTTQHDSEFLFSSFIFLLGFVIIFSINFFIIKFGQQNFLKHIFFFSILILFIIYVFEITLTSESTLIIDGRLHGYFSNPNQMAHWILCILCSYLLLLNSYQKEKIKIIFIIIASVILINATGSRGGLLAIPALIIGFFINIKNLKTFIFFLFLLFIIIFFKLENNLDAINRLIATNFQEELSIRGYNRLIAHPNNLIFGAGQGLHSRFSPLIVDFYLEIHSIFAGILFYYGIIGFFIFFIFFYKIFKSLSLGNKFIMLSPFIYGLTDFTARTLIFWIFISVCLYKSETIKIT